MSCLELAVAGAFHVEEGVVEALIAAKADVNGDSTLGAAPMLHEAVEQERMSVVAMLVKAKANLDVKNNAGATALHLASKQGRADIVMCLLAAKADAEAADAHNETALQIATEVHTNSKSRHGVSMPHAERRWGEVVKLLSAVKPKPAQKKK